MKFVGIFLISAVVFVAAYNLTLSQEKVRDTIDEGIEKTHMTCENHEKVCPESINGLESITGYQKEILIKGCLSIINKYLCEGKNDGEAFIEVYNEFVELEAEIEKTIHEDA